MKTIDEIARWANARGWVLSSQSPMFPEIRTGMDSFALLTHNVRAEHVGRDETVQQQGSSLEEAYNYLYIRLDKHEQARLAPC